MLKRYQEKNKPEFIQRKAREKLEQEGHFTEKEGRFAEKERRFTERDRRFTDGAPSPKKRRDSVEPLERPPSGTPPLPEELKLLQVETFGGQAEPSVKGRPKTVSAKKGKRSITDVEDISPPMFYGMTDMHEIIKCIRDYPKLGFLYLSPAVSKSSVKYHYYNLK